MQQSIGRPNSTSRLPGTMPYRTAELTKSKSKTTAPLTVRPITPRHPPQKQIVEQPVQQDEGPVDEYTKKFISNLKGQIHLLELEAKLLNERLASTQASQTDVGIDAGEVNPTLRRLREMYRQREKEAKTAKQVCSSLIFIQSHTCRYILTGYAKEN